MAESPLLRRLSFARLSLDAQRFGLSQRRRLSMSGLLAVCNFKYRLSRFSISSFQCVHNSCPLIWPYHNAINQHIYRLAEIDVQQRFRCCKLKDLSILEEPAKTFFTQVKQ